MKQTSIATACYLPSRANKTIETRATDMKHAAATLCAHLQHVIGTLFRRLPLHAKTSRAFEARFAAGNTASCSQRDGGRQL